MARADLGEVGTGEIRVGSGVAELLADADRSQAWMLVVDRVPQSYVDLADPTYLDFDYVQRMAHVLDALPSEWAGGALAVTHIGGGACTLVRYVAHVRPGSSQLVLEPDEPLTALVRARLPFDRGVRVRIRPQDGRRGLAELKDSSADVIVLDAFLGGRTPADLTTVQAFAEMARVLTPGGVLLANLADGGPLAYVRRVVASVRTALPTVLLQCDAAVRKGRRFGNVVLAASRTQLPAEAIRRAAAGAPWPATVLDGAELANFVGTASVLDDEDGERSPEPPEETWRVGGL